MIIHLFHKLSEKTIHVIIYFLFTYICVYKIIK